MFDFNHIKTSLDDGFTKYKPLTYRSAGYGYIPYVLPVNLKPISSFSLAELAGNKSKASTAHQQNIYRAYAEDIYTSEPSETPIRYKLIEDITQKVVDEHFDSIMANHLNSIRASEAEFLPVIYPEVRQEVIKDNYNDTYKNMFIEQPIDESRVWHHSYCIFTVCKVCELIHGDSGSKFVQYRKKNEAYICRNCLEDKNISL